MTDADLIAKLRAMLTTWEQWIAKREAYDKHDGCQDIRECMGDVSEIVTEFEQQPKQP